MNASPIAAKVGWSVAEYIAATSVGRTNIFAAIKAGKIKSVNLGRRRVITTPPAEFLSSLAEAA